MSSHSYEVALFGEFYSQDLKAILNRITLHSESSQPFQSREILFDPVDAQAQRDSGTEPILLRAKKEISDPKATWSDILYPGGDTIHRELFSYLKPESVRVHPEATVRPWATCQVTGDALSFAAGLGYVRRSQIYKRGYAFRRGMLVILMFQQEQIDPKTQLPIPAHTDTLWEVEVKTAQPIRNTQETPLSGAIEAVLEIQLLMKGLLDLRRQDV